jgi:hypothetical protein
MGNQYPASIESRNNYQSHPASVLMGFTTMQSDSGHTEKGVLVNKSGLSVNHQETAKVSAQLITFIGIFLLTLKYVLNKYKHTSCR